MTDFRKICLPYCIQRQDDGRYIILNRNYKPIGFTTRTGQWLKYEDYPISLSLKITPTRASQLSGEYPPDLKFIFLYDDYTIPTTSKKHMTAYLKKLELLAKWHEDGDICQ